MCCRRIAPSRFASRPPIKASARACPRRRTPQVADQGLSEDSAEVSITRFFSRASLVHEVPDRRDTWNNTRGGPHAAARSSTHRGRVSVRHCIGRRFNRLVVRDSQWRVGIYRLSTSSQQRPNSVSTIRRRRWRRHRDRLGLALRGRSSKVATLGSLCDGAGCGVSRPRYNRGANSHRYSLRVLVGT
jgi:hypothetical protein